MNRTLHMIFVFGPFLISEYYSNTGQKDDAGVFLAFAANELNIQAMYAARNHLQSSQICHDDNIIGGIVHNSFLNTLPPEAQVSSIPRDTGPSVNQPEID